MKQTKISSLLLLVSLLILSFSVSGKNYKIGLLENFGSYIVTIDKISYDKGLSKIYGTIRQKPLFNNKIRFEGCQVIDCDSRTYSGKLVKLDKKPTEQNEFDITDKKPVEFVLSVPEFNPFYCSSVTLKLGIVLGKKPVEIIIEDIATEGNGHY